MEVNALLVLILGGLAFFPAVALLDRSGRRQRHSSNLFNGA
jgi:hypothetical protein